MKEKDYKNARNLAYINVAINALTNVITDEKTIERDIMSDALNLIKGLDKRFSDLVGIVESSEQKERIENA